MNDESIDAVIADVSTEIAFNLAFQSDPDMSRVLQIARDKGKAHAERGLRKLAHSFFKAGMQWALINVDVAPDEVPHG